MHSSLVSPGLCLQLALLAALTLLLSGWTCNAFFSWDSCKNEVPQAQLASLSPDIISSESASVLLILEGSGFTPQSVVLWNGSALDTVFHDAHHLQTTITRQTFDFFGGAPGSSVSISVRPQGSGGSGCSKQSESSALPLLIQ